MEKICRLCLNLVPENTVKKLIELSEIMLCLRIDLTNIEDFPKLICEDCQIKIQYMKTFHQNVTENESKLLEHLNRNTLLQFYSQLTKPNIDTLDIKDANIQIKQEFENDSDQFVSSNEMRSPEDTFTIENEENITQKRTTRKVKKINNAKTKIKPLKYDPFAEHDPNLCVTCFKEFDSSLTLSKHYRDEHSIQPDIKLESDVELSTKYTSHETNGQNYYKCNSCGDTNEDEKEIVKHVIKHLHERPFLCKLCGKTYKTCYEILRHGKVHAGFRLFCRFRCGYSSPYSGTLRDHEKRHNDQWKYTCKTCGKGFLVKTWYEQHQNIHKKIKPYVCDFCGIAFHMHRYLAAHRSKKHPGLSAIKKFICTKCSFTCDNKNGLTKHAIEEHSENPSESKLTLLCDLCGKGFIRTDHLMNHMNGTHYGIKPYSCSVCKKQFQKKFNMKVHERTHTGEGRHLCLYCGKFYAQKSTLHRHQKKRHPEDYARGKETKSLES